MLVVVSDRHDTGATALVQRWRAHEAQLLTSGDLTIAGWCHSLEHPGASTAVVGGRVISISKIEGVLTLLPYIMPDQLIDIVAEDRAYVAAEMMAFLVSWLYELSCPVLNRPTPTCLMGLNWRPEQWVHAAAYLGIPVRQIRHRVSLTNASLELFNASPTIVTVVGDRWFGRADDVLATHALRLAAFAGLDLLAVHFDRQEADARLVGAELRPDVSSPEIADAILQYFRRSC
jgi:hypothetical protein